MEDVSIINLKKEIQDLKAENERLKKQLSAPREAVADAFGIVQQVQGLVGSYMAAKDQIAKVQKELDTRNEDIRRLQKLTKTP